MSSPSVGSVRKWLGSFTPLKAFYYSVVFVVRVVRNRLILTPIDRRAPFSGPFGEAGVYHAKMSPVAFEALKRKFGCDGGGSRLNLDESDLEPLRELFDFLTPAVRAYLGQDCYLDGMNWFVSIRTEHSISSHWHTDNVGNRLRVFCCVEGDGSQPTQVLSNPVRIPSFVTWMHHSFIELFRWAGLGIRTERLRGLVNCDHRDGDIYVFDTQLLHRGAYESGRGRRVVLQIDFSNPAKHIIARGPIGTDELNTFRFDERLLGLGSFHEVLDGKRIRRLESGVCEYGPV